MVTSKLTEHIYAIKKIRFCYKNDNYYWKVIQEAKNIATLNHKNIVFYNNAWVEISTSRSELKDTNVPDPTHGDFYCKICDSRMSSDAMLAAHISGKKHLKNVKKCHKGKNQIVSKDTHAAPYSSADILKPNLKLHVKSLLYIQMEYCDCDLESWLDERSVGNELPFEMDITEIFTDILRGVAHIHSKGIMHRDLKPQNIFYSKSNNCLKIGDFGLATLSADNDSTGKKLSCHSSNLGTRPYAAPEQISSASYDSKVDMYSLSIILIEISNTFSSLFYTIEFDESIERIQRGRFDEEMENNPKLAPLCANLISPNPINRRSAKDILTEFEQDTREKLKQALEVVNKQEEVITTLKEDITTLKEDHISLKEDHISLKENNISLKQKVTRLELTVQKIEEKEKEKEFKNFNYTAIIFSVAILFLGFSCNRMLQF